MNTVLLSNLFSLPRIVYAMAEDGLFFSVFSRVNPVTKVPVVAILVFGGLMALMALLFDLEALVQFLSIGTLLAYTFVAASIIVLRFQPERKHASDGGGQKTDASANVSATATPSPGVVGGDVGGSGGSTATTPSAPPPQRPLPPQRPVDETQTLTTPDAELKEYESFSDKLQLVESDRSNKSGMAGERRPPGHLKARWEPYLGRILDQFEPGEAVALAVALVMVSSVSLCAVLVFGSAPLHLPTWSFGLLLTIFSLTFLLSLVLIWAHEQRPNTKTFQVRECTVCKYAHTHRADNREMAPPLRYTSR